MAGIGAMIKPNKFSILKFVDLHPGGAAALSGQVPSFTKMYSYAHYMHIDLVFSLPQKHTTHTPVQTRYKEHGALYRKPFKAQDYDTFPLVYIKNLEDALNYHTMWS